MKKTMMGVWFLVVGAAVAAPTGVTVNGYDVGGGSGEGWTYDASARTVSLTGVGPYVLSGANTAGEVMFAVRGSAVVTLSNLCLRCTTEGACCIEVAEAGAEVTLNLEGVSTLDASAGGEGLRVDNGAKLTVSSSDGSAELIAWGGEDCAAISVGRSGGSRLEIAGGTVCANWSEAGGQPRDYSVGIGTSYDESGEFGTSDIVISGGRVFARGGDSEPGIGAADFTQSGAPAIRITGGYVEAEGGIGAAGIGGGTGGRFGSVTVEGGTVFAAGGAFAAADMLAGQESLGGGGFAVTGGSVVLANLAAVEPDPTPTNATGRALWCVTVEGLDGSVSLTGLDGYGTKDVYAVDGNGRMCLWLPNGKYSFVAETRNASIRCTATVADANATVEVSRTVLGVTVNGVDVGWGTGAGWCYDRRTHYVEVTGPGSYVLAGTNTAGEVMFAIDADAEVTLSNLCLRCTTVGECCVWATNDVDVTLFLAGTNTLDASGGYDERGEGLCIENGTHLTVTNAPGFADADAVLVAKGSYERAAIAVGRNGAEGRKPCFEIAGGTVFANWESPDAWSAGIGTSYRSGGNGEADIVISGGRVFARGGDSEPGIGAADNVNLGAPDIRITGGYVEAEGGGKAAGIGGGWNGNHGSVAISGGTVKVTGGLGASDMLAGEGDKGGDGLAVTGGSVCLTRLDTVAPSPAPTNATGQRVWCVTVEGLESLEGLVSLEGLEGYGVKDIVPVDGKVYLWLPDGEHEFTVNGCVRYRATVDGANAVATPMIPYRAWNSVTRQMEDFKCIDFTVVTADTVTFEDGKWYVVMGTVSRGPITVNGSAHLILCDGASLTATGDASGIEAGVYVNSGNALAIYGQAEGSGALTATGAMCGAGIGGDLIVAGKSGSCGTVTINGGTVTATCDSGGAGIGGGWGGSGGTVTINGGTVVASSRFGAGIGSGTGNTNDPTGGTITINGGKVVAAMSDSGAGIGGGAWCGSTGNIRITGGTVVASAEVLGDYVNKDIGYGDSGRAGSGTIEIVGGSVCAVNDRVDPAPSNGTERVWCVTVEGLEGLVSLEGLEGYGVKDIVPIDGKVYLWLPDGEHEFTVNGCVRYRATVDGANAVATPMIPYRAWNSVTRQMEDLACADYTVVTADTALFEDGGWYVVKDTVSCGMIAVNGSAHLILCDGAKLTANGGARKAGVSVVDDNSLFIYGQTLGTGELVANGGSGNGYAGGAGIGGGYQANGGKVTINGGTVTATGGLYAAGIGGGDGGRGGDVTVYGGTVTVIGKHGAQGLGGGSGEGGGVNRIYGGSVKAEGGENAFGVGGDTIKLGSNMVMFDITNGEPGIEVTGSYFRIRKSFTTERQTPVVTPLAPGCPSGPFGSEAAARAAIADEAVVLEPTDEVMAELGEGSVLSVEEYKAMFAPVVFASGDKWCVLYELNEDGTNALNRSVHDVVENIDLAAIAALPSGGKADVKVTGCEPGFYYTLYGAVDVRALPDGGTKYGPELCNEKGEVEFWDVGKPSDAAGFFTVGVGVSAE